MARSNFMAAVRARARRPRPSVLARALAEVYSQADRREHRVEIHVTVGPGRLQRVIARVEILRLEAQRDVAGNHVLDPDTGDGGERKILASEVEIPAVRLAVLEL